MENLYLRDARESDRDAIQAVTLAAYEQYAAPMNGAWKFYRANILETLANVKTVEQIVAETSSGIVGTVLLYPRGTQVYTPNGKSINLTDPEIRLLAVTPRARGQGIGQQLMQECFRRARQSGAKAITLHTTDMMSTAMRMYERMGFVRAPELDFHPGEDITIKGYRFDFKTEE